LLPGVAFAPLIAAALLGLAMPEPLAALLAEAARLIG
jgi:hypothetical protein